MKLILLFLTMSFLLPSQAFSQEQGGESRDVLHAPASGNKILRRIIPALGIVAPNFQAGAGGAANGFNNRNGFNVGVLADLGEDPNFVLETGIQFKQLNGSNQNGAGGAEFTNNYVTVPLTIKYYFSGASSDTIYAKAGLNDTLLVSKDITYNGAYETATASLDPRNLTAGLLAAVGGKLKLTDQGDLYLEGSYGQGLQSLFNNMDVYDSAWNLMAGVSINL